MMKAPAPPDAPVSAPRPSGFQAQIKGASLGDLVQMECLGGSRRAVRVTSGQNSGFLYFRAGAIVHAVASGLTGEAAVLDMLGWNEGSFEPVEREWPTKDTVSASWQSLLIRAAHVRDERNSPSVLALRADGRAPRPPLAPVGEAIELQATPFEVAGHVMRTEDFALALRLDANGAIVFDQGATQDLADAIAYACRLAELIGEHLGVGPFRAMECAFKGGRWFVVLERDGSMVVLRPHASVDCGSLRELLGV